MNALARRSSQLEALIQRVDQGVAVFEHDGQLLWWNDRHGALHGFPTKMYRSGASLETFVRMGLEQAINLPVAARLRAWAETPLPEDPIRFEQPGSGSRILEVEILPTSGGGYVWISHDITERKQEEARILHLAQRDPLTGLANRLLFEDCLKVAAARARTDNHKMAVMIADIDQFKRVNDAFGHAAGDEVLKVVAARLKDGLREGDTVARVGGDEFALILPDLRHRKLAAKLGAAVAERLTPPIVVGRRELSVRVSIGVACYPSDGNTPDDVVQQADFAMYEAKAGGVGLRVYDAPVTAEIERRMRIERDFGRALEEGALELEFQPQIELRSGRIVGVEALLRWTHPVLGHLAPELIVEAAERSGRMAALGHWILREASLAGASLPATTRIAVNATLSQFLEPDFVGQLSRTLGESGLSPRRLELEIVETSMLPEDDAFLTVLQDLRARGIRIALDDFGAGHACLNWLRTVPADVLKIDRSFITDLDGAVGQVLVEATIRLAHQLGLTVVAEGVETEAQRDRLAGLGCDLIQGHIAGRPLSLEALHARFAKA